MADENDLRYSGPEFTALVERVTRLELELAALERRIAEPAVELSAADATTAWTAPPPPPPPVPQLSSTDSTGDARQLASEMWGSIPADAPTTYKKESSESLESQLGSQIFNRIAIVLLLIGTAYFLKLAVDRQWIGPAGRVLVGLLGGAGLVLWSERFRNKGFAAFSYSLKAVGSGVLYLSLWAAFQLYGLIPAVVAMGLMILVTAWNAYMAWVQDSELLAAYALAGGFATPMLVSTGGNHEIFLFTYMLAIDLAVVALVRLKSWPRLLIGAFPLTVAFFVAWFAAYYAAGELAVTALFIVLFGAAFASVAAAWEDGEAESDRQHYGALAVLMEEILLPLANAAFVALAFSAALDEAKHHALIPWAMVILAAAYLGLMRVPQRKTAAALHLSIAVVLLTIAVPLKASGYWITVSWLVEGLALLWVATQAELQEETADAGESYAANTLRWLGSGALLLGFCGVCTHIFVRCDVAGLSLLNRATGTALVGLGVFAGAAWLALRAVAARTGREEDGTLDWGRIAVVAFLLIDVTAALLTLREILFSWEWTNAHAVFYSADFVTALMGMAVFAGVIAVSLRLQREQPEAEFWPGCAGLSTIAFNLIAVLTGVREIAAVWGGGDITGDAALRQALAISAYLMLYGAGLLAVGFWKRNSFLRWQALLLLVFTIFKTFLYDMRNLSEGYRVVSLLGLGALLMAISFAYQKDWLGLRESDAEENPNAGSQAGSGSAR